MYRLCKAVLVSCLVVAGDAHADADILIGVAGPLTGPNASIGEQFQKGTEQAAADLNRQGGINGQHIKLEFGDDVSDPKQGVSVANKFAGDGVKYVIGHLNSGVTIPASEIYAQSHILLIVPTATSPHIVDRGLKNVFTIGPSDSRQVAGARSILKQEISSGGKTALVFSSDMDAENLSQGSYPSDVVERLNDSNGFDSILMDIQQKDADGTIFVGSDEERQNFVNKMFNGNFLFHGNHDPVVVSGLTWAMVNDNPQTRGVTLELQSNGFSPNNYALLSYAALQVIADAIGKGGSDDPDRVASFLHSGQPVSTILGDIGFNTNGEPLLGPASAGIAEVCSSGCPKSCSGSCTPKNGSQCCSVASMPEPPSSSP
jgi:branched-chain amino acid transport system substrate-binding protein